MWVTCASFRVRSRSGMVGIDSTGKPIWPVHHEHSALLGKYPASDISDEQPHTAGHGDHLGRMPSGTDLTSVFVTWLRQGRKLAGSRACSMLLSRLPTCLLAQSHAEGP